MTLHVVSTAEDILQLNRILVSETLEIRLGRDSNLQDLAHAVQTNIMYLESVTISIAKHFDWESWDMDWIHEESKDFFEAIGSLSGLRSLELVDLGGFPVSLLTTLLTSRKNSNNECCQLESLSTEGVYYSWGSSDNDSQDGDVVNKDDNNNNSNADAAIQKLVAALERQYQLKEFYLSDFFLPHRRREKSLQICRAFLTGISHLPNLEKVYVDSNFNLLSGASCSIAQLCASPSMTSLLLQDVILDNDGAIAMAKSLTQPQVALEELYVDQILLEASGLREWANMLRINRGLSYINLRTGCSTTNVRRAGRGEPASIIDDKEEKALLELAAALKVNKSLKTCYIECCSGGGGGSIGNHDNSSMPNSNQVKEAFVETLEFNSTLERIDLSSSRCCRKKYAAAKQQQQLTTQNQCWDVILDFLLELNKKGVARCLAHESEEACSRSLQVDSLPALSGNLTCLFRYLQKNPGICDCR